MTRNQQLISFCFFSLTLSAVNLHAASAIPFSEPLDHLSIATGKQLKLDTGIGSGAFRLASDPANVIYTITDRGPNIDLKDAEKIMGADFGDKKGKVFPTPNFSPSIYSIKIEDGKAIVLDKIQLKTASGIPLSGISNPDTEEAWDINGNALPYDIAGIDAEGLVRCNDGSFWVGEEYGPSILHLTSDGRVIERWVPKGVKKSLDGADYPIAELLPAILRKRPLNRGIESMAISPDEKFLYFAMQSPLANPDKEAYTNGRNLRIFKIDAEAGKLVGEYVYVIDTADTFRLDNAKKQQKQNDVKVSEMTAVGTDKLVVLERISKTTKFYAVDLADAENILNSTWDDSSTSPSLEQHDATGLKVLNKKLLFNSDDHKGLMAKIEGLAWMGADQWVMVNDNDFGITGESTEFMQVNMPVE